MTKEEYAQYKKIEGWHHYRKLYTQAVKHAPNRAKFVEIGAWQGKSTFFMACLIKDSKKKIDFTTIDTWEGAEEHKDNLLIKEGKLFEVFLKNIEPVKEHVRIIRNDSSSAAGAFEDESLDFVMVDGDHSEEGAKKDLDAWWPKVKKGGIFSGDDLGWKGVKQAVTWKFPWFYCWAESRSKSMMWLVRKGHMQNDWTPNEL